jgi:hypothetical protein
MIIYKYIVVVVSDGFGPNRDILIPSDPSPSAEPNIWHSVVNSFAIGND